MTAYADEATPSKVTGVLLKITGTPGQAWWESLGLPPPWKWGDDRSFAYVVEAKVDRA